MARHNAVTTEHRVGDDGPREFERFGRRLFPQIATLPRQPQQKTEADIVVATVAKNAREEFRVALCTSKGKRHVALRVFACNGLDMAPKHGVGIRPILRPIIDALIRAECVAKLEGLI